MTAIFGKDAAQVERKGLLNELPHIIARSGKNAVYLQSFLFHEIHPFIVI
jgi:uncharacterized protein with ACT and thioredoxin-like domain